jgi:hypothetical protein
MHANGREGMFLVRGAWLLTPGGWGKRKVADPLPHVPSWRDGQGWVASVGGCERQELQGAGRPRHGSAGPGKCGDDRWRGWCERWMDPSHDDRNG